MFYQRTWTASADEKNIITIKHVVLGLMRVRMKENEYVYMPVWDFIGDWETNGDVGFHHNVSFLTLNAVDGSVIDRAKGY